MWWIWHPQRSQSHTKWFKSCIKSNCFRHMSGSVSDLVCCEWIPSLQRHGRIPSAEFCLIQASLSYLQDQTVDVETRESWDQRVRALSSTTTLCRMALLRAPRARGTPILNQRRRTGCWRIVQTTAPAQMWLVSVPLQSLVIFAYFKWWHSINVYFFFLLKTRLRVQVGSLFTLEPRERSRQSQRETSALMWVDTIIGTSKMNVACVCRSYFSQWTRVFAVLLFALWTALSKWFLRVGSF